MVYLDYSATTPVNLEVLKSFNKVVTTYPGNANSLHELGRKSFDLMEASSLQIANLLNVKKEEVIFTSGASEANNLAIIGTSVLETVEYLKEFGIEVEYLNILENGLVDLDDLKRKIKKTTILVSISHVNSEVGTLQDVNKIGEILKNYPTIIFHVDGTQAVGKIKVNLENIDLYSLSAHKIYGLKGVGCLIKKKHIELTPLIHGGKSQRLYRSGTPCVALYASFAKALKLALNDLEEKYQHVLKLNERIKKELETMKNIHINSNLNCIPHILNISIDGIKPETMLRAMSESEIYISTKTACSNSKDFSLSVYEVTKNLEYAKSSLRISLSYLTTDEEITYFLKVFKEKIKELSFLKGE